jgi:hypothetical protein
MKHTSFSDEDKKTAKYLEGLLDKNGGCSSNKDCSLADLIIAAADQKGGYNSSLSERYEITREYSPTTVLRYKEINPVPGKPPYIGAIDVPDLLRNLKAAPVQNLLNTLSSLQFANPSEDGGDHYLGLTKSKVWKLRVLQEALESIIEPYPSVNPTHWQDLVNNGGPKYTATGRPFSGDETTGRATPTGNKPLAL